MSKARLYAAAFGIGLIVVLLQLASGGRFTVSVIELVLMLMVATPFLILAAGGIRDRLPWLTGLALTAAIWGWLLLLPARMSGAERETAGAGYALLLLGAPLLISVACIAAYAVGRRSP